MVISHGPNGLGGYTRSGGARSLPTSDLELPNARPEQVLSPGGSDAFVAPPFRQVETDPDATDYYDDLLLAATARQVFRSLGLPAALGPGPGPGPDEPDEEPPQPGEDPNDGGGVVTDGVIEANDDQDVPDFVFTEGGEGEPTSGTSLTTLENDGGKTNAINLGERDASGEPIFNDPIILEQSRYACAWANRRFLLTGRVFVAYFHFLFTQVGSIQDDEGFTFTVLPGSVDVSDAATNCGQHLEDVQGADLGYVGQNQGGPKFALEFDMAGTSGPPRFDPSIGTEPLTHVALLADDSTRHLPGDTANPSCSGVASQNGAVGGCTFRTAEPDWLKSTGRSGLMSRGLPQGQHRYHTARIEVARNCDPSCGSCNAGGSHIRLRARIDCPARDGEDQPYDPSVPGDANRYCGFSKETDPDWVRAGFGLWDVGENSINHCFPEPGDGTQFHTVKVGFTSAADAGNELASTQILDFVAGSYLP